MRPHALHIAQGSLDGNRSRCRDIACVDSMPARAFSLMIDVHCAALCGLRVRLAITGPEAAIICIQLNPRLLQAAYRFTTRGVFMRALSRGRVRRHCAIRVAAAEE